MSRLRAQPMSAFAKEPPVPRRINELELTLDPCRATRPQESFPRRYRGFPTRAKVTVGVFPAPLSPPQLAGLHIA
jgi:hypothetical protein